MKKVVGLALMTAFFALTSVFSGSQARGDMRFMSGLCPWLFAGCFSAVWNLFAEWQGR